MHPVDLIHAKSFKPSNGKYSHQDSLPLKERFELDPLFIVGLPRTGSTALQNAIESSEKFQGGHFEGHILYWLLEGFEKVVRTPEKYKRSFKRFSITRQDNFERLATWLARAIDGFMREAADIDAGKRWIDKTPDIQQLRILPIAQLLFPKAQIIFTTRHPRDQVISQIKRHNSPLPEAELLQHWADVHREFREQIRPELRVGSIYEIRQEDLVKRPEEVGRALGAFLGMDESKWDAIGSTLKSKQMNRTPREDKSKFTYENAVNDKFLKQIEELCSEEMYKWGYSLEGLQ
ncbi:sulfotransferase [bacterium]|nr:sulfotransferase [bacterium]